MIEVSKESEMVPMGTSRKSGDLTWNDPCREQEKRERKKEPLRRVYTIIFSKFFFDV